jgi:hypothetical protein
MQKREIKIFNTFEEQEDYQLEKQRATTPLQRFQNLFYMQQLSLKFRPSKNNKRTIILHHGYTAS